MYTNPHTETRLSGATFDRSNSTEHDKCGLGECDMSNGENGDCNTRGRDLLHTNMPSYINRDLVDLLDKGPPVSWCIRGTTDDMVMVSMKFRQNTTHFGPIGDAYKLKNDA